MTIKRRPPGWPWSMFLPALAKPKPFLPGMTIKRRPAGWPWSVFLPSLVHNPAPLSNLFNLPLLSGNQGRRQEITHACKTAGGDVTARPQPVSSGRRMKSLSQRLVAALQSLGPRVMPFADVVTADMSLARLLRLSLFQVSVGMALVLLVGTLNRVMIVELGVPASLVGIMIALPLVFAPFVP